MPNAANAALWMAGERLCDTGHPMMPTVRVEPATRAPGTGSSKAFGLVGQELVVAHAEPVGAVATAQDVVEVRHVRRVQSRPQRRDSGTRDRCRRQSRVQARVVRTVDLEVGDGESVRWIRIDVA